MITAFEVLAKLGFDDSSFRQGVDKAEKSGKNLSDSLTGSFDKIKKAAAAIVSVAVIKKGIDAIRELASETAAAGDKIDKQSQVLGMSRKAYQEWDYILSQNGSSIESMSTAMKTLNNTILEGIEGNKESADSLAQLGLHMEELSDLSQEDQFEAVVRAFQKMPAGAQKSALAVKLFGRQGMQLLPLLNNTETSIDELRQRAEELGLIMGDDAIDASVEYTDSLDTMKRTFNALKYSIGAKVMPVITDAMQKVTNYAGKIKKAYEDEGLSGVFNLLRTDFMSLVQNLKDSDSPVLKLLGESLEGVQKTFDLIVGLFTNFDDTVAKLQESDNPVLQVLAQAITTVKDGIDGIVKLINGDWLGAIKTFKDSDSDLLSFVGEAAESFVVAKQRIDDAIDAAKEFFGVSGSNKSLYGKYTAEMAHAYSEITSEEDLNAWADKLKKGMLEAGFDIEHARSAVDYFKGLDYTDPANQRWVSEALGQLSNPLNFDKDKIIEGWQALKQWNEEHKEELQAPIEPEVSEAELQEEQDKAQRFLNANPLTQRLIIQAEGIPNTAPQGYLWQGPDQNDGEHAKGLWDVPYDGYIAELHRGERVLTASQARDDSGAENFDMRGFMSSLQNTVKSAIESATIRSYLNGKDITEEVNRNNTRDLKARRYAT